MVWRLTSDEWLRYARYFTDGRKGPRRQGRPRLQATKTIVEAVLYHHFHSHAPKYRSTGWNQLPKSLGVSPATANRRYREWHGDGRWNRFWDALWLERRRQASAVLALGRTRDIGTPVANAIRELHRAHRFLNRRFFGSALPPTVITIETGRLRGIGALGFFHRRAICIRDRDCDHIGVTAAAFRRGETAVLHVLLHEMVHQWNAALRLRDSSSRQYHNVLFRDAARLVGLDCTYDPVRGYAHTVATPRALAAFDAFRPRRDLLEIGFEALPNRGGAGTFLIAAKWLHDSLQSALS